MEEANTKNANETQMVKVGSLVTNNQNPRFIKDTKFQRLLESIQEFPEMLKLRPIITDENNIVLGGNMRLMACQEAGIDLVPVVKAKGLSEAQKQEFIIKDNSSYGEWDWEKLTNEWQGVDLEKYGLDQWAGGENVSNENDYFGLDAESKLEKFLDAKVKSLTIPFESQEFDQVVLRLESYLEKYKLNDYREMVYQLLENEGL